MAPKSRGVPSLGKKISSGFGTLSLYTLHFIIGKNLNLIDGQCHYY